MKRNPLRPKISLQADLGPELTARAVEPVVKKSKGAEKKKRLNLDTPLIPPAGRKLGMTNEELYELIELP